MDAKLFLILSCVILSGCASREELVAKKAAAEQTAHAESEKHCGMFGYKPGTPDYSKCLESLYLQDQQLAAAEEANRAAKLQAAAQSLQQAGASLSAISPPPPPPRQPIECQTFGNRTTCQ
jgi:hypothetical protein